MVNSYGPRTARRPGSAARDHRAVECRHRRGRRGGAGGRSLPRRGTLHRRLGGEPPFDSQRVLGDDDRELVVTTHLAFGRVQGKDRIYVLKATLEKNEGKENFTRIVAEDRTPWAACSREVKLQSFAMLPELLGNLAARVEEVSTRPPGPSRRSAS